MTLVLPHAAPLWSSNELAARLGDTALVVFDASWYLPTANRNPLGEFVAGHVPGAQFFDLDAESDPGNPLPHMLPSPEQWADRMGARGVGAETDVVIYDSANGLFSAPRVWWMFRVFGHDRVYVLDGGLPRWIAGGHPIDANQRPPMPKAYPIRFRPELVRGWRTMADIANASPIQIVDARSGARFVGDEPEPRPGLRSGHIPGSRNVHYGMLSNPTTGGLRAETELRAVFAQAGVDPALPVVATCGSGVTACVIALALAQLGYPDTPVYDGSWAEWGGREDLPVATAPHPTTDHSP